MTAQPSQEAQMTVTVTLRVRGLQQTVKAMTLKIHLCVVAHQSLNLAAGVIAVRALTTVVAMKT
eukprot:15149443-Ditylum_brightwellii.AAC.1